MYESGDLRKGLKIEIDGQPHVIVQFEFTKPGKGQALYKCKLKNMITGSQFDRTYRSDEKFKEANLEEHDMEYLYFDGDSYCFMNTSTYEQEFMTADQVGDAKDFLKEKGVDFEDIDVSKDREAAKAMIQKSGQMGVPQIEINGKIIVGFDKPAIEAELKAMG